MFVFWTSNKKVERVRGGRVVTADCPDCGAEARFHECRRTSSVKIYGLLDVETSKRTLYRCERCGGVFEMERDETPEPARGGRGRGRGDEDAARQAADERRARQAADERRARQAADERRTRQIDDELAALKRKLNRGS
jgi:predicted RNA-binding Zn-ribbon protein involved in translation (DUF1610 family)